MLLNYKAHSLAYMHTLKSLFMAKAPVAITLQEIPAEWPLFLELHHQRPRMKLVTPFTFLEGEHWEEKASVCLQDQVPVCIYLPRKHLVGTKVSTGFLSPVPCLGPLPHRARWSTSRWQQPLPLLYLVLHCIISCSFWLDCRLLKDRDNMWSAIAVIRRPQTSLDSCR